MRSFPIQVSSPEEFESYVQDKAIPKRVLKVVDIVSTDGLSSIMSMFQLRLYYQIFKHCMTRNINTTMLLILSQSMNRLEEIWEEIGKYIEYRRSKNHDDSLMIFGVMPSWLLFITFNCIYFLYVSFRSLALYVSSNENESMKEFSVVMLIFNFAYLPISIVLNIIIFKRLKDSHQKIQFLNIIIAIFQLLFSGYALFFTNANASNQNATILRFCVISLAGIFLVILATSLILKMFIICLNTFIICYKVNITSQDIGYIILLIAINISITIYMEHIYFRISIFNTLQHQTLQSIPCGICVIGREDEEILYINGKMNRLIENSQQKEMSARPFTMLGSTRTLKSMFHKKRFEVDDIIKSEHEMILYMRCLYVDLKVVFQQFPEMEEVFPHEASIDNNEERMVDLKSIVDCVLSQKEMYIMRELSFRCDYIEGNSDLEEYQQKNDIKDKIIIDVRIKNEIMFQNVSSIMLTFYDISQTYKFIHYKSLNNFKSRLIKSISHELRTRLNIIQGMIEIILNQEKHLSVIGCQLLEASYNNCKIQAHIIGSIIDYHLIQEKQLNSSIQKLSLPILIDECVEMFEEEAKLKGITIKFKNQLDEQYDIEVDGNRLLGVLVHIISNSLKFTSSGSIMITLSKEIEMLTSSLQVVRKLYSYNSIDSKSRANRKGNNAFQVKNIQPVQQTNTMRELVYKIDIADTGLGMSPARLQEIREILMDDDQQAFGCDSSEGIMMGLRVSNKLLKHLNKDQQQQFIKYSSEVQKGTTVSIMLKAVGTLISNQDNIESIQNESLINKEFNLYEYNTPSLDWRNKKYLTQEVDHPVETQCTCQSEIMLVDDEPYNLLVLSTLMKQFGQATIQANNGLECVNIFKKRLQVSQFNNHKCGILKAIIMDYQMPQMNGRQATEAIHRLCYQNEIQHIPIFGCTGFSADEDIKALTSAGMVKVYTKPISRKTIQEIFAVINEIQLNGQLRSPKVNYIDLELQEDIQEDPQLSLRQF